MKIVYGLLHGHGSWLPRGPLGRHVPLFLLLLALSLPHHSHAHPRHPTHPPHSSPAPPGIDFAGVHDSFWTHAGTVERMNELLREKFIELHSQVGPRPALPCCWQWPRWP